MVDLEQELKKHNCYDIRRIMVKIGTGIYEGYEYKQMRTHEVHGIMLSGTPKAYWVERRVKWSWRGDLWYIAAYNTPDAIQVYPDMNPFGLMFILMKWPFGSEERKVMPMTVNYLE